MADRVVVIMVLQNTVAAATGRRGSLMLRTTTWWMAIIVCFVIANEVHAEEILADAPTTAYVPEGGGVVNVFLHERQTTVIFVQTPLFDWANVNPWLHVQVDGNRLLIQRVPGHPLQDTRRGRLFLYVGGTTITLRIVLVPEAEKMTDQLNIELCESSTAACSLLARRRTDATQLSLANVAGESQLPIGTGHRDRVCLRAYNQARGESIQLCVRFQMSCSTIQSLLRLHEDYRFVSDCERI